MTSLGKKLTRKFYQRPTLTVARELIGKTIVYESPTGRLAADIVEVEAYIGEDDPACHAAAGLTERNGVMFGKGGFSYIYFIYGMYYCFNVVTERAGFPAAVLLRAAEPVLGEEIMTGNSPPAKSPGWKPTDGPGKFCRAFGLTRKQNGLDLTGPEIFIVDRGSNRRQIGISRRIGIRQAADRPWRFFDSNSRYVSRKVSV